jgi:alpha,alpha-trehalose phosphorylase
MAQQNLQEAAGMCDRHPDQAEALAVTTEEMASWRDAALAMMIPYDARLGVHQQSEGFTEHARWDFERTAPEHYPLLLHYPYFDLYRKQVVKQADLVLAMHLRSDAFTPEQKRRNFDYYESLTVRDSSLSACTQAVLAAEVGHLDLALDYLGEAALMDLRDLERNTRDGLHMASLAGAWTALVGGFGGFRAGHGAVCFAPRLPSGISRLRFRLRYRSRGIAVSVTASEATYELLAGAPIELSHHGEAFILGPTAVTRPVPHLEPSPRPTQPAGRAPVRRLQARAAPGRV